MKPLTLEWIEKAERDFFTMERESRVRKEPNYDGVCFHAQQCAEKYLKALMVETGLPVPKSHDLVFLLENIV
jgi:HEPN domain-containing protein